MKEFCLGLLIVAGIVVAGIVAGLLANKGLPSVYWEDSAAAPEAAPIPEPWPADHDGEETIRRWVPGHWEPIRVYQGPPVIRQRAIQVIPSPEPRPLGSGPAWPGDETPPADPEPEPTEDDTPWQKCKACDGAGDNGKGELCPYCFGGGEIRRKPEGGFEYKPGAWENFLKRDREALQKSNGEPAV